MNESTPYQIKDKLMCPNCNTEIDTAAGVTPEHSRTVRKGQVVICAVCKVPNIVGDSSLEKMTEAQFRGLDQSVQRTIALTIRKLVEMEAKQRSAN